MIYIKRFLKFSLVALLIIVLTVIATISVVYLQQQTPLFNAGVAVVLIAVIAIIDVHLDRHLARRRANFNKEANETQRKAQ